MSAPITAKILFDTYRDELNLSWIAGRKGADRAVDSVHAGADQPALVGTLNLIHPSRIQVLGKPELAYLAELGKNSHQDMLDGLFQAQPIAVIVTDGQDAPTDLIDLAERNAVPLLGSRLPCNQLVSDLQYYSGSVVAKSQTLHGVFMEVMGAGVLLTGDCGVGKSELALELISRGHRLIADDAPQFARIAPDLLSGTCPDILRDFLEVRGLGILNIRAMFGDSVIKSSKYLRLILHLECLTNDQLRDVDRLQGTRNERTILGVSITEITLPVAPGRSLAVLIETAVRDHILRTRGYEADKELANRQKKYLQHNLSRVSGV